MWQQQKKDSLIINFSLLMAVATTPLVANLLVSLPVDAQEEKSQNNSPDSTASPTSSPSPVRPAFPLPTKVENGTVVKIDGSINSIIVNQSLKENFEKNFSGTQVEIYINGNEDAIKSVLNGKVDVAALGRKLTPEEKAQGLEQILVRREKIAIVVSTNNTFYDSLSSEKFAKIFRGEITDWSELGGNQGKIRFIDRPTISDTRSSFKEYAVFQSGSFMTGGNAVQMVEDNTPNILKELGSDGISYVLANQISKLEDVRALRVQDYFPSNSKYPFSQSFVYVYKKDPSQKVKDFLGFLLSESGKDSVKAAREAEALAIAASRLQTISIPTVTPNINLTTASIPPTPTPTETSTDTPTASPTPSSEYTPEIIITPEPVETGGEVLLVNPFSNPSMINKNLRFFLLLPLLLMGGLSTFIPLWLRRRKPLANEENEPTTAAASPTLLDAKTVIAVTNNHQNGNGLNRANYYNYKQENSQEVTAIGNVALLETPVTIPTINQTNRVSDLDFDSNLDLDLDSHLDLEYTEGFWDIEAPVIVVNNHYPQILNIGQKLIQHNTTKKELNSQVLETPQAPPQPKITSLSELLGISATSTSTKQDITLSKLPDITPTPVNQPSQDQDLSYLPLELGQALNAISNPITLQPTPDLEEVISRTPLPSKASNDDIAMALDAEIEAWTNINQINGDGNTRIIFTPRTPKWAYVSWSIAPNHQQTLENQGFRFTTLAVRLYDVTNLDLSYQRPQFIQQYECEAATYSCYVPIPRGERDYMTEIGYMNHSNQWLCLARSGVVRIFSRPSANFWFAVDTELILYGVTEEGATVTFDGEKVKLNPDGTFKLTLPFVDNFADYQLIATSTNKEDTKIIHKKFSQG
jgi:phosphate transport system substrate-binding protein